MEIYAEDFDEEKISNVYSDLEYLEELRHSTDLQDQFAALAGDKKLIFTQTQDLQWFGRERDHGDYWRDD